MATRAGSSGFKRFMNSPTGPKTVHFWAPVMKWGLVIAGINDLNRPVEKVSGTQQLALMATGLIWTRWCTIIKPKNYLLASVNFFLGCVASFQVYRLFEYNRSQGYDVPTSIKNILSPPPKKIEAGAASQGSQGSQAPQQVSAAQ